MFTGTFAINPLSGDKLPIWIADYVLSTYGWLFSRQRYWGEPIPIIHWEDGSMTTVPEDELPLLLPETDEIKPSGTGESPLANIDAFVNVIDEKTGMKGRRETNTMPQWAGSCWHVTLIHITKNDSDPEKLKHWLPVDLYIGGVEHAVLHLLYARFWHKAQWAGSCWYYLRYIDPHNEK